MPSLRVLHDPPPEAVAALRDGLSAYNAARVPALRTLYEADFSLVARDVSGTIIGGVVGEFNWGWLFIDTLWVEATRRGYGLGRRLMRAAEDAAAQQGMTGVFLFTTRFQAPGFYANLGYDLLGQQPNRPRGYTTTYFGKMRLIAAITPDSGLTLHIPPDPDAVRTLNAGLRQHAAQTVPLVNQRIGAFMFRDDETLAGGFYGNLYWDWLDLRYAWIADDLRGRGYGGRLLRLLEDACRQAGAVGVTGDTASFQAFSFYEAHGYQIMTALTDRPPGYTSYVLTQSNRTR